ncbi:MAG: hypothetical protein IPM21_15445 [Acidobacteria bacterium]|nr:hypothetical protein [Acidobacteriota bacterium]
MTGRQVNTFGGRSSNRRIDPNRGPLAKREPFRLPATGFYIAFVLFSIIIALFVWLVLYETGDESAANWAIISGVACLSGAVIFREAFLTSMRKKMLSRERRLISNVSGEFEVPKPSFKLTVEHNAAWVRSMQQKSDAANVLGGLADGHREVFLLCEEYLEVIKSELPRVAAGSPRFAAFRKGTVVANRLHYEHMIRWAKLEAAGATGSAGSDSDEAFKRRSRQAAQALDTALSHYPDERLLIELRGSFAAVDRVDGFGEVIDVEGEVIEAES